MPFHNYTYFIKLFVAEQVCILQKKDSILYHFTAAVDKDVLTDDVTSLIRAKICDKGCILGTRTRSSKTAKMGFVMIVHISVGYGADGSGRNAVYVNTAIYNLFGKGGRHCDNGALGGRSDPQRLQYLRFFRIHALAFREGQRG